MRSFRRSLFAILALTVITTWRSPAAAQQQAQGFAVDRLYPSAPGGGWIVMDTLDRTEGLGGVVGLTAWYAHDPHLVRTSDGSQRLAVVSDEALASFAFAVSYDRWKLYLNLDMPLDVEGNGGNVGSYQFTAPNSNLPFTPSGVNPSTAPDAFADARVGLDVRLLGETRSAFRLGAGAQLLVSTPNTPESEYLTDGALRAMGRLLFAGDIASFSSAWRRVRDCRSAIEGQWPSSWAPRFSARRRFARSWVPAGLASRGSCRRASKGRRTTGRKSG